MRAHKLTGWFGSRAACAYVACVVSSVGCGGSPPARRDATAAEAGAGGELDADMQRGRADAQNGQDAQQQVEAAAEMPPTFVGNAAATWEGTGAWAVEVVLPGPAPRALRYGLITGGTSQVGQDYTLATQLEFSAGESRARVMITIVNDSEREPSETLSLTIVGTDPPVTYTLRIADDDDDRWPTDDAIREVDAAKAFPGANWSGLAYQPARAAAPAALWMVRNGPSQLHRLTENGALFGPSAASGFGQAKTLVFANGVGAPDSEDLTFGEWSSARVYVVSERDGSGPSAPTVLAYDTSRSGTTLTATHAWNLSNDLRSLALDANTGPEAITWVPDSYLTSAGFLDEATGKSYDPTRYPNHGTGLLFVGIEQTGGIYAYALDHTNGSYTRVASIDSGQAGVMALVFDREVNYLWAWCDDACGNHATILRVEDNPVAARKGRFSVRRSMNRPPSLPNLNHEGMTIAPSTECTGNKKAVFWLEDGDDDHVLRRGTVPCGWFLDP